MDSPELTTVNPIPSQPAPTGRQIADECGVFGVWAPGEDVARMTNFALYALQHRGTQSAGIAASDGSKILVYKDMGLVSQVFSDKNLSSLIGNLAIGHVRYATTGADVWENAQPTLGTTADGGVVALAHNGNITNHAELADVLRTAVESNDPTFGATTDTSIITALLGCDETIEQALTESAAAHGREIPTPPQQYGEIADPLLARSLQIFPHVIGAFSLVYESETTLYAARDPHGIRPLVLGRLENGWCVTSETAALDIVGASFVREIEPGEILVISANGVESYHFAQPTPHLCAFEYVYLARPDTRIAGKSILVSRTEMGAALARRNPVEADLVIATPDSGTPAAIGYAQESGIPFGQGIMKNAYVGRTFIQPSQSLRKRGIKLKLNPIKEVIEGKRLVVVDDSIVRGNTQQAVVKMLREAGAKEVHVRISAPEVTWPCFFGIDFATRAELASAALTVEELRVQIGADSLAFLDVDDLVDATGQAEHDLCIACFTGNYPVDIPAGTPIPGAPGVVMPSARDAHNPSKEDA